MTITIRHAEASDIAAVKAIYQQPHAYADTLQLPYPSEQLWQQRFESWSTDMHNLVAEIDGVVVGQLGLAVPANPRRKHTAEFGMGVCGTALRRGVGSALVQAALELCDNWLNVRRIELEVYADNNAAIALYQKFGFEVEGKHPDSAFRDGEYVTVLSMGRLRT